jgi:hypothetical protein
VTVIFPFRGCNSVMLTPNRPENVNADRLALSNRWRDRKSEAVQRVT